MISDKIKIEIDLLRDSLRNIFFVMFAIMSCEITVFYRLIKNFNYLDFIMFIFGFVSLLLLLKVKQIKRGEINKMLERMEG